jgi:hypothetical protein
MTRTAVLIRGIAALGIAFSLFMGFVIFGVANAYTNELKSPVFWLAFLAVVGLYLTTFMRLFALRRWAAVSALMLSIPLLSRFRDPNAFTIVVLILAISLAFLTTRAWRTLKSGF